MHPKTAREALKPFSINSEEHAPLRGVSARRGIDCFLQERLIQDHVVQIIGYRPRSKDNTQRWITDKSRSKSIVLGTGNGARIEIIKLQA